MKKNKNLKLLRAWFSFLARYTRKKKSLWCMAAILLVIGIAAAQNADRHEIIRIGLYLSLIHIYLILRTKICVLCLHFC